MGNVAKVAVFLAWLQMESVTSQPHLFSPATFQRSLVSMEYAELDATSVGILKQHVMGREWSKGIEGLYKGVITVKDHTAETGEVGGKKNMQDD